MVPRVTRSRPTLARMVLGLTRRLRAAASTGSTPGFFRQARRCAPCCRTADLRHDVRRHVAEPSSYGLVGPIIRVMVSQSIDIIFDPQTLRLSSSE
jgi:hypothetical protein